MIQYDLIGQRIREMRKRKNLTQETLSETLDVSPEYISRIENAKARPNLEILSRISSVLEIPLEKLICGVVIASPEYINYQVSELLADIPEKKIAALVKILKIFRDELKA